MAAVVPSARAVPSLEDLRELARQVRIDSLKMTSLAGSGHPGGSMSMADIAVVLFHRVLDVDPARPKWPDRDRFVLSKGHCSPGHYSVLAQRGFFPREELWRFRRLGALLQGHSDIKVPGVEMSAGSLGQGLSFGVGCALAARIDGRTYRTFVMLGDGELQEGQVWEAAMTASHHELDNLIAIVDHNKIQIDGFVDEVKSLGPLADRWRAFGWHVLEIDGHDLTQILAAFEEAAQVRGRPAVIIAHTVKGKGVSFMESKAEFHGRSLNEDEMKRALAELGEVWIA